MAANPLDLPVLVAKLHEIACNIELIDGLVGSGFEDSAVLTDAAAALATLTADRDQQARRADEAERERDEARKDAEYHADCRPNRREAEQAMAERDTLRAQLATRTQEPTP